MSFYGASRRPAAWGVGTRTLATRIAGVLLGAAIVCGAPAVRAATHLSLQTEITTADSLGVPAAIKRAVPLLASRIDCSETSFFTEMMDCDLPVIGEPGRVARGETFVGGASTYNPNNPADRESGGAHTATGELYDEEGWTAAIRTDLRWYFGGVRYGRNYQPTFALVEGAGRRVIVRINDVGPLKPGRIIDLNVRTMRHLDPTMQVGVIPDVKVMPLFGDGLTAGPVASARTALAGDFEWFFSAPHLLRDLDNQSQFGPLLLLR